MFAISQNCQINNFVIDNFQIHTGLQHGIIRPCQPNGLPLEMPTIANKLKDVGYRWVCITDGCKLQVEPTVV